MIKVGDKINFKANGIITGEIKDFELIEFKGKNIVIYFYPKDLTPGCTVQAENLRDNFKEFIKRDIILIGISLDSIKKHLSFIEKKELPFILISDEDKKIVNLFGVWQLKKFMGREYMGIVRTTFLLNKNLEVFDIIEKPKVKEHSNEIFERFNKYKL